MKLPFPDGFPWCTQGRMESGSELESQWRIERGSVQSLPDLPLVSWILPFAAESSLLKAAIRSQSYDRFEVLCGSPTSGEDTRFRRVDVSGSFSHKANAMAEQAIGEWLCFVDENDVPSPVVLFQWLREVVSQPKADLVFSHEAVLTSDGIRLEALWGKTAFSWLSVTHFNGVGRAWMVRRSVFLELGGFSDLDPNEARWEFLLRLAVKGVETAVVPSYLWYRKLCPSQAPSEQMQQKVSTALHAKGVACEVSLEGRRDERLLKVKPRIDPDTKVSVVVCFRNRAEWTVRCLKALGRQTGVTFDLTLVDNQSSAEQRALVFAAATEAGIDFRILSYDGPFHFARMNNTAVAGSKANHLFFLNNDVVLENPLTLAELTGWAGVPGIGTVGLVLRYPDGRIQHDGIRASLSGGGRMARIGHQAISGPFARQTREVFASTFAACLVSRELYEAVGGLSELDCVNGFGDVAFQLEARRLGYRHLLLGHLEATHGESASRGLSYEYWEEISLERRFPAELQQMVRQDLSWIPAKELSRHARSAVWDSLKAQVRQMAPGLTSRLKMAVGAWGSRQSHQPS